MFNDYYKIYADIPDKDRVYIENKYGDPYQFATEEDAKNQLYILNQPKKAFKFEWVIEYHDPD